jgi:hypothetical protein
MRNRSGAGEFIAVLYQRLTARRKKAAFSGDKLRPGAVGKPNEIILS